MDEKTKKGLIGEAGYLDPGALAAASNGDNLAKANKPTISLDFDGVIHTYEKGWLDGSIYGELRKGCREFLNEVMEYYSVFILSTREPMQIKDWLVEKIYDGHDEAFCTIEIVPDDMIFWNKTRCLGITNRKLLAAAYIVDRAVMFGGFDQHLKDNIKMLLPGSDRSKISGPKTLHISDINGAKANIKDIKVFGNGDTFKLLCKASSEQEGWMKSTKVCNIEDIGCLVQVTTQQRNHDGTNAVAEALVFVPGACMAEFVKKNDDGSETVLSDPKIVPMNCINVSLNVMKPMALDEEEAKDN